MAAKTSAAAAVKEKPQIYEVSPKWILIYQLVNLVAGIIASFLSYKIWSPFPLFGYFLILFMIIFEQCLTYIFGSFESIRSKVYHPDLLPQIEFAHLNERFEKILSKIRRYKHKGKAVPEKCQHEYDTLKQIIDAQNKLHVFCWFKFLIGEPKSSSPENFINAENIIVTENAPETTTKNASEEEAAAKLDSDAESENQFSKSEEDESDSEFVSSDSDDTDVSFVDDKKEIKSRDSSDDIKNDLENLKARFSQIQAENAKLKTFVETFIESQSIV